MIIISVSCGNKPHEKLAKEYKMILLQERYHNIRYDLKDIDFDSEKILNLDSGENISTSLCIISDDTIYIDLNFSEEYFDYFFTQYTIQKLDNYSLIIKAELDDSKDTLLLKINTSQNILTINENKYFLNDSYTRYIVKEGFNCCSIIPFLDFINIHLDDFWPFHDLKSFRCLKEPVHSENKILKAEIKTAHPFDEEKFYNWSVKYIYNDNQLKEIIKYDQDMDVYYHFEYTGKSTDYDEYAYTYTDTEGRVYGKGSVYFDNNNLKDSTSYTTISNQRGQSDEYISKIVQYRTYQLNKLNLTKTEITELIRDDL